MRRPDPPERLIGRRVRLTRAMTTHGHHFFPAGTEMRVTGYSIGRYRIEEVYGARGISGVWCGDFEVIKEDQCHSSDGAGSAGGE